MVLTEEKIVGLFSKYKKKAQTAYKRGKYSKCLKYIKAASLTGYFFYLGYKDDELEDLLQALSSHLEARDSGEVLIQTGCVFYDSLSADNEGLVQQYLRAIMCMGLKITYITEKKGFKERKSILKMMLEEYENSEIIEIPSDLAYMGKAQFVYDQIILSKASRLFIHSHPTSSYACTAFYALPDTIKKYKINLTDQTFWIGTRFIDYSFEFRAFGCVLSSRERGISKGKLLMLPYYPVFNESKFLGFPQEADGKVILFSGGNHYKIYSKDDMFFKIAQAILDSNPNVILLFAGKGDLNELNAKLTKYGLTERFIPIGHRSDITEVFRHCDIYLNTYPIGGGLMLQYAALLGKPIVCYQSETTAGAEDIVCQLKRVPVSDRDIPSLVGRVQKLANSPEDRQAYGKKIQECMVTEEKFNQTFEKYLAKGKNLIPYSEEVSYKEHTKDIKDKLDYENSTKEFQCRFVKTIGMPSLWECPDFLYNAIRVVIRGNRLFKTIKNNT